MDYVPMKSEPCDDQHDRPNEKDENCIVKMRGLPWSVTADDILSFLSDCEVEGGKEGIHLTMSPLGRSSGEAYVELASPEDADKARAKDHEHMGHRYIEVFGVTRSEMDWVVSHSGMNVDSIMDEGCIRMRGLPYGCTKEEVLSFFSGLQIVPNGINFVTDHTGRATGEAYVQFVNKENLEKALQKHMDKIGLRYIEVFRSSLAEVKAQTGPKMRPSASAFSRMTPYNRSERLGGPNRFRGIGIGGSAPFPRMPRHQNVDYWEDSGSDDCWRYDGGARSVSQNKPSMRGGFRGASDSEYGPLYRVHMRGLPYRATESDVATFFRPLRPNNVTIIYDRTNRPSGEATVLFDSHEEAVQAMCKDKEHIQNRYIELVLDSDPDHDNFGEQSCEGDPIFSPSYTPRPRGGAIRSRRIGNRARPGRPPFGYNNRVGQGRKPFMSSSGRGFRSTF